MNRIRVTFYFASGKESNSHDYETSELAFEACTRYAMWALAHPVGTTSGAYSWNPSKEHNLEDFKAKLAICCNDPAEYSEGLRKLGIACFPQRY